MAGEYDNCTLQRTSDQSSNFRDPNPAALRHYLHERLIGRRPGDQAGFLNVN
jgi:hypothetical protein